MPTLGFRVTDEELAEVEAMATASGLSVRAYVRQAVGLALEEVDAPNVVELGLSGS